jgi:hypothetical protein
MTRSPADTDNELITQAPTRETVHDLCRLLNDLFFLHKLKKFDVLEDTVDHPERSVLLYAYGQVRDRPWLAEPIRDMVRHMTLGLAEAAQMERLMESRMACVAQEDHRRIRDALAALDPGPERDRLRLRLEDAAGDKLMVLRALGNGLAAHMGGYAAQISADYARFTLPDSLRPGYQELLDLMEASVRKRVPRLEDLVVPVDPFDPQVSDYDGRIARLLGEDEDADHRPAGEMTDLDARLGAIHRAWTHDGAEWTRGIAPLTKDLLLLGDSSLIDLLRLLDKDVWITAMLGMPPPVVSRVLGLMSDRVQALFLRDMEERTGTGRDGPSAADVITARESILGLVARLGLTDGGAARLGPILHPPAGNAQFDALAGLADGELNALWRRVEKDKMGTALLGAPLEVAVRFLERLSDDARHMMLDDMEHLSGRVTAEDIRQAQMEIVAPGSSPRAPDDGKAMDGLLADIRAILGGSEA